MRLAASIPLHSDPGRVAAMFAADLAWLGELIGEDGESRRRRLVVDLRMRVGGDDVGFTTFRKAAFVDLGAPRRVGPAWEVEIGWLAATMAPLFPVLSGRILIGPERLGIVGLYAPPGGMVGRAADRLLLHLAANGTARWLLRKIEQAALGAAA